MRRLLPVLLVAAACSGPVKPATNTSAHVDSLLATYTTVRLDANVSNLTENERKMLPLLIDAAKEIDAIFWREASALEEGKADAHGRANVACFNYFQQMGAFARDGATGTYRVDFDKMHVAMDSLSGLILRFQGDGDYDGVIAWKKEVGTIRPELQGDLARLATAGIPVDIIFEQGTRVLGLEH